MEKAEGEQGGRQEGDGGVREDEDQPVQRKEARARQEGEEEEIDEDVGVRIPRKKMDPKEPTMDERREHELTICRSAVGVAIA